MRYRFKFRVWSHKQKKMYNWSDIIKMTNSCYALFVDNRALGEGLWYIQQCTGLKDKNGKLIYEGDIVKFKTIQNLWAKGKVVFTESCALFEIRYGTDFNNWELMDKYQYEVIGNIYENPDLLENTD